MSKHTPGPWVHCTEGFPSPDVRSANGRAVALTWMVCSSTPKTAAGYQARCEEDRANARLIAAAPELLEALKTARALITEAALTGFNPMHGDWPDRLFASQQATSAAIAKAEGEKA